LHLTYLFGSITDSDETEIPPLSEDKYEDRQFDEVNPLLTRINQHITPLGTLVIEGYNPDQDWLKPKDLKIVIRKLINGQTYLFSANEEIRKNRYLAPLIDEGKIIAFNEPLYKILTEGSETGSITLGTIPEDEQSNIFIDIGAHSYAIPISLWRRVSNYAEILDSLKFVEPPKISLNEMEFEFQYFLANSSKNPIWTGYARNFAFSREYGKKLINQILSKMKGKKLEDCPIIIHGQSGSGKTIVMQQLAYEIAKTKQPVLFIDGAPSLLENMGDILNEFCEWAEKDGANKVLIVWDGMVSLPTYQRLFNFLSNRGRKVILIGSSYKIDEAILTSRKGEFNFIEAPIKLNDSEIQNLSDHFSKFYLDFFETIKFYKAQWTSDNFLVLLYRLLPSSRGIINSGIANEIDSAEENIRKKAKSKKISFGNLLFEQALKDAGYVSQHDHTEEYSKNEYLNSDVFTKVLQFVMVPGRLGQKVPLDLIQRTIQSNDYLELQKILEQEDIFSIVEEKDGNYFVSPRHSFEAKIICNWRFGGPSEEIKHCLELFNNIYCWNTTGMQYSLEDEIELKFLLELVKKLGPNGPEKTRYRAYYYEISNKLSELRKMRSINAPGLILQEANLAREYVIHDPENKEILKTAEEILNKSIKLLEDTIFYLKHNDYHNLNMIDQMTVELVANKSTKANQLLKTGKIEKIGDDITSIQDDLDKVLKRTVNEEHALDTYGWSTINLVKSSSLKPLKKTELIMRALKSIEIGEFSAFGITDSILDRKRELLTLLGENQLSDKIFKQLESKGSRIGYLRCSIERLSKISMYSQYINQKERELCKENYLFLENSRDFIKGDLGCLYQLLKSWWMMKTGKPIFKKENERQAIPFNKNDWLYCDGIFNDMRTIGGFENNPSLVYLYAITQFHLGSYETADKAFKSLAQQDIISGMGGGRRIIKYYLASSDEGEPIVYHGKVVSISVEGNSGFIEVEELHRKIRFFPRDFRDPNLREGNEIEPFHIGFNFINPVADPTTHYKSVKR
jgi:hypothetical protein